MHTIDVEPARTLAHILFYLGLDAEANYGDIGELRTLAQGPYIRIKIGDGQSPAKNKGALQGLLFDFYKACGFIDIDRQLIVRRLGQFGELLLVTQFAEFFDITSDEEAAMQLTASNEELARFTEYLKTKIKKHTL